MKNLLINKKGFNFFRENSPERSEGFTLLEVLVTTAIIGLLFTVSSAIFINTIRSANKANITNEAKENSSLVLEALERDVRAATSTTTSNGNHPSISLGLADGSTVVWDCVNPLGPNNRYITRQKILPPPVGPVLPLTNRDPQNGVNALCSFDVVSSSNILVTIHLSFTEGKGLSGPASDITTLVSHNASFSSRGH